MSASDTEVCRAKAQQLRLQASKTLDHEVKQELLRIAQYWDNAANLAERVLTGPPKPEDAA